MNIKQKLSFILLLLSSVVAFGQSNWNHLSIESGYGYAFPSRFYSNANKTGNFSLSQHFDIGMRYMFDNKFGVKLSYANLNFVKNNVGLVYNTISVDAVYNVGSLFDLSYITYERIGLLGHAGVGLTLAKPTSIDGSEKIGTATIGLTPQLRISDRISLYGDASYALRFKQNYGFNGVLLDANYESQTAKTLVFSAGVIFYIGENKRHVDWY